MPTVLTFTKEQKQQIIKLRESGMTWPAIAGVIGRKESAIKGRYRSLIKSDKTIDDVIDEVKSYPNGSFNAKAPQSNTNVSLYEKFRAPDPDQFGRLILPRLSENVLVIPDLQAPFHAHEALPFLSMVAQRYQVDDVVCIGDEVDFNWASDHKKCVDIDQPVRELELAIEFMDSLFKMFPKAYSLTSNHVHGRLSTMRKNGRIPRQLMHNFRDIIGAPKGWEWYEEVHFGNVLFRHGDKWPNLNTNHIAKEIPRDYGRHMSVIHGHLHTKHGRVGDAVLVGDDEYWGAYTGCLINPRAEAFDYTKAPRARLGCLVISKGEVHRIPFRRDEHGRWTGKL